MVLKWRSCVYIMMIKVAVTREFCPPNATIEAEYEAYVDGAPTVFP